MANILIYFGLLACGVFIIMMIKKKKIKRNFLDKWGDSKDKILMHSKHQTKLLTDIEFYLRFFFYLTILSIVISIIAMVIMLNSSTI